MRLLGGLIATDLHGFSNCSTFVNRVHQLEDDEIDLKLDSDLAVS